MAMACVRQSHPVGLHVDCHQTLRFRLSQRRLNDSCASKHQKSVWNTSNSNSTDKGDVICHIATICPSISSSRKRTCSIFSIVTIINIPLQAPNTHSILWEVMSSNEVDQGIPKLRPDKAGTQPCQSKHLGQCLLFIRINSVNSGFPLSFTNVRRRKERREERRRWEGKERGIVGGYNPKKMSIIISVTTKSTRHKFSPHFPKEKPIPDATYQTTSKLRLVSFSNMRRIEES